MDEADRALHGFNRFVYTYRTRYLSPFVLGKVYQCRSHIGCDHRLKLATHRVDENTFRYQLLQRGKHSGTNIQLPARGISPVLKPELDALLKLGMSAGRVRNMLLFKYIREPDMLAHVPDVRKMENRKAYLKKKVTSHHRVIKVIVTDFKKAPTISVLNSVLPRVLLYDATNLSSVTQGHYAEGPLPLGAVMKAKSFLLDPQNHRIVPTKATQRPARIFFNTSKSMVQPKNMAGSPVTAARTERFQRSLRGWLGGEVPVADIQFTFLSLHQVTLHDLHLSQIEDLQLQSRWRFPEIVSIRRAMSCTCKRFKHSGWVCSHIIASLHLLDKLNIERALETIPMRGPPGRPRSTRGGLHRDDTCAVDRLIEVFTKNPGRALKWPVVEEFEVVDDGVAVPDRRIGQVAACRLSPHDGVYIWTATFVDGDTAEYKVEELVHAIRRARDMSASV
eukprot:jgi/Phyca11/113783/e_gw1.25.217.1